MIIYIHGFGGSGEGSKARLFRDYFRSIGETFIAPSLSYVPELAIATLEELIRSYQGNVYLIGSSLGGYYATYLSTLKEVKRVVLINPATKPYETLKRALGDAPNFYDSSHFEWRESHLEMLKAYQLERNYIFFGLRNRFMVFLQKGDELLDYQDAIYHYDGAKMVVEEGGSHSFDGMERHLEAIRAFFAVGDHFKHTPTVKGVGLSNKSLALRMGDLYYDDLADLLGELSKKIKTDAKADFKRGRTRLADALYQTANALQEATESTQEAWDICRDHTIRWMIRNGFNKEVALSHYDDLPQDILRWYYGREITLSPLEQREIKQRYEAELKEHYGLLTDYKKLIAFKLHIVDILAEIFPDKVEEIRAIVEKLNEEKAEELFMAYDFERYYR